MITIKRLTFLAICFLFLQSLGCSEEGITGSSEPAYSPFGGQDQQRNTSNFPENTGDARIGEKPDAESNEEDSTAEGGGDTSQPTAELNFQLETGDDGEACAGTPTCTVEVTFLSDRDISVVYTAGEEAIEGGLLSFEWLEPEAGEFVAISPDNDFIYTDVDGIAAVDLSVIQNQPGVFYLRVSAEDNDNVTPITFEIQVASKLGAPLIITFVENYDPVTTQFASIETTLFKQTEEKPFLCDQIDLTEKIPGGGIGLADVDESTDIIEVPVLPNLEEEKEQHYTAVALAYTLQGALVVVGCNDEDGHVVAGTSTEVPITLSPVPPNYTGIYEITTRLDLLSFLPDEVEKILDSIFGLFESPIGGIAMLACNLSSNTSALDDFCGFIFADPENPEIGNWGTAYADIIIDVVDNVVIGLISSNELASDIFFTGKDLSELLTDMELHSEIEFKPVPGSGKTKAMPDESGYFTEEQTSHIWTEIAFKWTLNAGCDPLDDTCGAYVFNFAQFSSTDVAVASFEAQVSPSFYDMNVFSHSVNFKYGALLNSIIKTFLLPAVFGNGDDGYPKIDEYEEVIQSFMCGKEGLLPQNDCCEIFAENITNNGGSIIANTLEAACESLVPLGSAFLEQTLLDLDVDLENLTLETLQSCTLIDTDEDGIIDNWGTAEEPCLWDLELQLFGATANFDAIFYGVRKE